MTHVVQLDSLPYYRDEYVSKKLLEIIKTDGLIVPLTVMEDGHIYRRDRAKLTAWRNLHSIMKATGKSPVDTIIVCYWDELSEADKLECKPIVPVEPITMESKFDFDSLWHHHHIMDYVEGRKSNDLKVWMEILKPYWSFATRTPERDLLPALQMHAMACRARMNCQIIGVQRNAVMARLQQEEADRRGHGDRGQLHLHYPHNEVNKEVFPQKFYSKICPMDYEVLQRLAKMASVTAFLDCLDTLDQDIIVHQEQMIITMEEIRWNLRRRYIHV